MLRSVAHQIERKFWVLLFAKVTNRRLSSRPPNRIFWQLPPLSDSRFQYPTCRELPKLPVKEQTIISINFQGIL